MAEGAESVCPLHPNNHVTKLTEISILIRIHGAAHTPDEGAVALTADVHVAIAEAHAPREAGIAGEGSSRPVEGRLHVDEGMTGGERRTRGRDRRIH